MAFFLWFAALTNATPAPVTKTAGVRLLSGRTPPSNIKNMLSGRRPLRRRRRFVWEIVVATARKNRKNAHTYLAEKRVSALQRAALVVNRDVQMRAEVQFTLPQFNLPCAARMIYVLIANFARAQTVAKYAASGKCRVVCLQFLCAKRCC